MSKGKYYNFEIIKSEEELINRIQSLPIDKILLVKSVDSKYEITNETKKYEGVILHRIRAIKNFRDVKNGDLGGWVEKEENLEQNNLCWVYDNSIVMGNAKIMDDAIIENNSIIKHDAIISNNVLISNSEVGWWSKISNNVKIKNEACILLTEKGYIKHNVVVDGKVKISDQVKLRYNMSVKGDNLWLCIPILYDNNEVITENATNIVGGSGVVYYKDRIYIGSLDEDFYRGFDKEELLSYTDRYIREYITYRYDLLKEINRVRHFLKHNKKINEDRNNADYYPDLFNYPVDRKYPDDRIWFEYNFKFWHFVVLYFLAMLACSKLDINQKCEVNPNLESCSKN